MGIIVNPFGDNYSDVSSQTNRFLHGYPEQQIQDEVPYSSSPK